MMSKPPLLHHSLTTSFALLLCCLGCQTPGTGIKICGYQEPAAPRSFAVDFATCSYRSNENGDLHIVGRTHEPTVLLDQDEVSQYLHIHVYWRPRPGRTYTDSSSANATLRYLVATADGVAVYSGTGFVYPRTRHDGRVQVQLESGRLGLETVNGTLDDFLGPATIVGTLQAVRNDVRTTQMIREVELLTER